ncbi:MAG: ACT domain-containing protein [Planctomycetaceae bacterium]|nr:ACT domain-containing protein [Planctomycetaceae bacterium]
MTLRFYDIDLSVCRLRDGGGIDVSSEFFFLARTPDEVSLVCLSDDVPFDAEKVESGWGMFRVEGELDFGLVGILSRLTAILAENGISVFAVSTFNTDYVLVKKPQLELARSSLIAAGYEVV